MAILFHCPGSIERTTHRTDGAINPPCEIACNRLQPPSFAERGIEFQCQTRPVLVHHRKLRLRHPRFAIAFVPQRSSPLKRANRVDTFWGAGDRAREIAGGMAARGTALIFLPKAAVARLGL
jgi:hypothetical protein